MTRKPSVWLSADNDNQPKARKTAPRVIEQWPSEMPITCGELDLLERYLGSIVTQIAANDNDR